MLAEVNVLSTAIMVSCELIIPIIDSDGYRGIFCLIFPLGGEYQLCVNRPGTVKVGDNARLEVHLK